MDGGLGSGGNGLGIQRLIEIVIDGFISGNLSLQVLYDLLGCE